MVKFILGKALIDFIFYLVILWKFAVKTGRTGWSLYIPIYSNFIWCDIVGMETICCLMTFVPGIVIRMYSGNLDIYFLAGIFSMILHFCFCNSLAKRFNKGLLFTIGLFFLNPVFLAMLTFSKKMLLL